MATSRYASDKRALGICDRCGFSYKLKELRNEMVRGKQVSTKVCSECYDPDQPQRFLGMYPVYDPQALRDARPDSAELSAVRGLRIPVTPVRAFVQVGSVTINVS